jgi:hypothetical protein
MLAAGPIPIKAGMPGIRNGGPSGEAPHSQAAWPLPHKRRH